MEFQANEREVPNYLNKHLPNQTWLPLKPLKIKIIYHIRNNSVPKSLIPYSCFTMNTSGLMLSMENPGSVDLKKRRLSEFCMHFRVRGDLKHEIKWQWRQSATNEIFHKKCYFLNLPSFNWFNCISTIKGLRGEPSGMEVNRWHKWERKKIISQIWPKTFSQNLSRLIKEPEMIAV